MCERSKESAREREAKGEKSGVHEKQREKEITCGKEATARLEKSGVCARKKESV